MWLLGAVAKRPSLRAVAQIRNLIDGGQKALASGYHLDAVVPIRWCIQQDSILDTRSINRTGTLPRQPQSVGLRRRGVPWSEKFLGRRRAVLSAWSYEDRRLTAANQRIGHLVHLEAP